GGLLTGPYKLEHYRCEVSAVATNTAPAGPYRGVARPATTFVMERLLDLGARALNLDPVQIRRINLVTPDDLPYTSATRLVHDTGSYPVCFAKVVEALDYETFRAEQAQRRTEGRYLGIGFANYNELTGLGRAASAGPRLPSPRARCATRRCASPRICGRRRRRISRSPTAASACAARRAARSRWPRSRAWRTSRPTACRRTSSRGSRPRASTTRSAARSR